MELVIEAKDQDHAQALVHALEDAHFKVDFAKTV
jgi:threonine dehydratase